ncbi:TIGR02647 family protein [Pseudoalteromonas sp. MMG006]|uniref:TIGR02647 family protein n=1 Tax=Pseudoalteromonas TaxID=53246 RepID=UPI001B388CFC|nr:MULTISPECIES: TIGR02647 family protein [unclassified Pseudoalteromonas]MBQ4799106.1 TIGR02647 family protein [Pseudoalteromonas sp. MMG006]MBQ4857667.1 TIGR02647 family protein [Pseudoalteromonas sp. MMG007]
MQFNQTMIDEFTLLAKFPRDSKMQGIKLHSNAEANLLSAAQRLFDKGIIDSPDGGYLTDLGLDLIEHVTVIHSALQN